MEYLIFAGALLLFILLIMGKGYLDSKRSRKDFIKKLHEEYGAANEREYKPGELEAHISMYYKKHETTHQIDDITWNDLNLDDVYRNINYSHSAAGDEYLYYRLRTPMQRAEEAEAFEKHVRYFMEHENERVAMQVQFAKLGRMGKYSLYEYLDYLETLGERNSIRYYLAIILILISISMMSYSVPIGLCAVLIFLCRNMIFYYKEQQEIEPYITSFRYIARLLEAADSIAKEPVDEIANERKKLSGCYKAMDGFRRNSFIVLSGGGGISTSSNLLELLFDYIRMIFYLDLIKFNQMLRAVRSHKDEIDDMVTTIGALESAVVVGEYRASLHNGYCVPELTSVLDKAWETEAENAYLKIEQLYHPLLNEPVKNDIAVEKGVLLTGSNASGKSTFLRAAALNVILAQTIHTCTAHSYKASMFQVYSSMSLKDDLESGDSYYMVEVKSIRRILEHVREAEKNSQYVLCFVDEVLRGTNTVERISASTQILRALSGKHVICFAATHDLELTKLLADVYENYHFEEEIAEDDIFFPYRIQKGPAVSRNAIALLKMLGYEKGLVEDAEKMAQTFLQTGKWKV
ncbi:MAG: hypothetical protein NC231_03485 [Bacillus sp. (in: Bacteria)]|nr:hypothetical protein [Bacillus sp. (in: firmicutes)]MCM1426097.1 hypothetical protein [Eubacterium sp.]